MLIGLVEPLPVPLGLGIFLFLYNDLFKFIPLRCVRLVVVGVFALKAGLPLTFSKGNDGCVVCDHS